MGGQTFHAPDVLNGQTRAAAAASPIAVTGVFCVGMHGVVSSEEHRQTTPGAHASLLSSLSPTVEEESNERVVFYGEKWKWV